MENSPDSRLFVLDCLEFLARAFRGPILAASSSETTCPGILTAGVLALAEDVAEIPPAVAGPLRDLMRVVSAGLGDASDEEAFCQQLETDYVRLFIAARGGVSAPLYQSCYEQDGDGVSGQTMGPSAQAMQRRLDVAGLVSTVRGNEPADHLSTEVEYLYYLLHNDWRPGAAPVAIGRGAEFAGQVMLPWVERLAGSLQNSAPENYYCHAAYLLGGLLRELAKS